MVTAIPGLLAPGALAPLAVRPVVPAGLRVLGLDLSLTSTGVALPDGTTYRIKTRAKDGDRRLLHIRDCIRDDLAEHRPHLAVIEDLPKHAMSAGITAHVHGVVKCELLDAGVPYTTIVPATLKSYACDKGNADKPEMAAAAYLAAGVEFADDKGGDQADAWWLRAAAHHHYDAWLFTLPQAQIDRLCKVEWPALADFVSGVPA